MLTQVLVLMMFVNEYEYLWHETRITPTAEVQGKLTGQVWEDGYVPKWYSLRYPSYSGNGWFRWERRELSVLDNAIPVKINQPNIIPLPQEQQMLDSPNAVAGLFRQWDEVRCEPYLTVLVENWLRTDRRRHYPKLIDGEWYNPWIAPYSWVSDLNYDGITNMKDFGIVAKFYHGELGWSLKKLATVAYREFMDEQ